MLTLVNNWEGFGGKKQYVQWARDKGQYMNNDDDFFTNSIVKDYFKNHIKVANVYISILDFFTNSNIVLVTFYIFNIILLRKQINTLIFGEKSFFRTLTI